MTGFQDLPNELYLEILHQCHPRDLLTLIRASPTIFRLFKWKRTSVINRLIRTLFAAVPRPPKALSVARLRLLEKQCNSTQEYEQSVRLRFDQLTTMDREYVEEWPSDIPTLAVLADICSELDLLTDKVRMEHWDDVMRRAQSCHRTYRSLGRENVPLPKTLGAEETFSVQSGLIRYEHYCRLYCHGADTLHIDSQACRQNYHYRLTIGNTLPALQFVHNLHWNNLLELLGHERPGGTFGHSSPCVEGEAKPRANPAESPLHWLPPCQKAIFLRYLTSFGIHFATQVSHCSQLKRKRLMEAKFAVLDDLTIYKWRRLRHCFPQPDPYEIDNEARPLSDVEAKLALDERWEQRAKFDSVYTGRHEWDLGPWFWKTGPSTGLWNSGGFYTSEARWWWDRVCRFEESRSLARTYKTFMQGKYGN